MVSAAHWLAYASACLALAMVPGPTVTLIIATSLRHGRAAALANVAGTQAGFAVLVVILAGGFQAIVEQAAPLFSWLRLAGAAWMIWLGLRMILAGWRKTGQGGETALAPSMQSGFWRGFFILLSNPKVLLFLGAFLPQFVVAGPIPVAGQILLLGALFMLVTALVDSSYALAASKAASLGGLASPGLARWLGGGMLMGGGLWLALARRS